MLASIYTAAPPDDYVVLEGRAYFHALNPEGMPTYADVRAWSQCASEPQDGDLRFLEADVSALADAVMVAVERLHSAGPKNVWSQRTSRRRYPVPRARGVPGAPCPTPSDGTKP